MEIKTVKDFITMMCEIPEKEYQEECRGFVSQVLNKILNDGNMTQEALADILQVSQPSITCWLAKTKMPDGYNMIKIALAAAMTLGDVSLE